MRIIQNEGMAKALRLAMMESSFSGVIILDADGCITEMNEKARMILGQKGNQTEIRSILAVFPLLEKEILDEVLLQRESISNYVAQNRTVRILVNLEPIIAEEELIGAVLMLQRLPAPTGSQPQGKDSLVATHFFEGFEYSAENFHRTIKNAKFASFTDAPILLLGEDGTETAELAECIHNESDRRRRGYAEVECNALTSEQVGQLLFDSDLKASGEDAEEKNIIGNIEGGTLFLNHIEKLSIDLQYRICLLIKGQYAAEHNIHRYKFDVRIIAATSENLKELVRRGEFREDLYYALNALTISVPSLRERAEDIETIASMFVTRYSLRYSKPIKLTLGAYSSLREYVWPGNVRELDHFCKKLVLSAPRHSVNEALVRELLEDVGRKPGRDNAAAARSTTTENSKATEIIEALKRNGGNKTKTAEELGISKATLWRHMQKYGITAEHS